MKELLKTAILIAAMLFSILISFRALNAMLVHDDARIVIAADACPVPLNEDKHCVVQGNLTHNFIMGEAEITLPNKSILVLQPNAIHSSSYDPNKSHYEPFGQFFAGLIGIVIIFCIPIFGLVIPAYVEHKAKLAKS